MSWYNVIPFWIKKNTKIDLPLESQQNYKWFSKKCLYTLTKWGNHLGKCFCKIFEENWKHMRLSSN